jgi:hypothetical protein
MKKKHCKYILKNKYEQNQISKWSESSDCKKWFEDLSKFVIKMGSEFGIDLSILIRLGTANSDLYLYPKWIERMDGADYKGKGAEKTNMET